MTKAIAALLATLAFLALLGTIYYLHIRFLPVNVVFYAAIGNGVLATMLTAITLHVWRRASGLNGFERAQLVVIWLLTSYALAISVPTVLDRSLSFYILEKLQQRGGGIVLERFEDVFVEEYMVEHRLVDVRLTEQLQSGTIEIVNGCVLLTARGERIAGFSRAFRRHFLPRTRLLMGEFSDDLTDPFRHSADAMDYICERPEGLGERQ